MKKEESIKKVEKDDSLEVFVLGAVIGAVLMFIVIIVLIQSQNDIDVNLNVFNGTTFLTIDHDFVTVLNETKCIDTNPIVKFCNLNPQIDTINAGHELTGDINYDCRALREVSR